MRRLKTLSILLFIVSAVLFGANLYKERIVDDKTGPVFHMDSELAEISVKDTEAELLKGVTAEDASDGDVTDSIIVEAISPFTGTGRRIVTYAAFDSDNHVTHAKRELKYTDYEASRFRLSKPLSFPMNATNLLEGITATDYIDGDLTKSIKMMSDDQIDTAHVGEYNVRLKVTNSAGGVSYLPVTVEIYDASVRHKLPQIELKENLIYIEKGDYFDEKDNLESITVSGTEYTLTEDRGTYGASYVPIDETDKTISYDLVEIDSDVDTDVSGYYEVVYTFEDTEYSTGKGKARLYVVVTEGGTGSK